MVRLDGKLYALKCKYKYCVARLCGKSVEGAEEIVQDCVIADVHRAIHISTQKLVSQVV